MEILDLLEPHKLYTKTLKAQHKKNAEDYFDNLVKVSEVNVEENKKTIKELNEAIKNRDAALQREKSLAGLRIFLIVLIVLFFIGCIVLGALYFSETITEIWALLVAIGLLIGGILLIVLICTNINKELAHRTEIRVSLDKEVERIKSIAYGQMMPLNVLFDWNMSCELVTKTAPLIKMDYNFDLEKFEYLNEKYGFDIDKSNNKSVVFVQSGSIEGNPFLIEKIKNQTMVDETYVGTKVISWTETKYSNGKSETVRRTQTLTATITKPKPVYYYETWLVYGNDAAPSLTFSRTPSPAKRMNDKDLDKFVEKQEKVLEKLAEDTLVDDKPGEFVKMANTEFDALFGAKDRDNEREFRLLFTPLGQKSMLNLIKEDEPFGDDFVFIKRKCLNYIHAKHANNFNYDADPSIFAGYDVEEMKKFFVNYNENYFESFFFQLAPILTIPLYQQQKPVEYIYQRKFDYNTNVVEHEVMANAINNNLLMPDQCRTDIILKTSFLNKNENADTVQITSYGFREVQHTTYVSVWGGDGRYHDVPVHWIEYIEVSTNNVMEMSRQNISRKKYDSLLSDTDYNSYLNKYSPKGGAAFQKGLLSILLNKGIMNTDINSLNNVFK